MLNEAEVCLVEIKVPEQVRRRISLNVFINIIKNYKINQTISISKKIFGVTLSLSL